MVAAMRAMDPYLVGPIRSGHAQGMGGGAGAVVCGQARVLEGAVATFTLSVARRCMAQKFLSIKNFERYQTCKPGKTGRPWIKLYKSILGDPEFIKLSVYDRFLYIGLLLLADDCNNRIYNDPEYLAKRLYVPRTEISQRRTKTLSNVYRCRTDAVQNVYRNRSKAFISCRFFGMLKYTKGALRDRVRDREE